MMTLIEPSTLPRGIRPYKRGYIVDVSINGKRRTKTAKTLHAAIKARAALVEAIQQETGKRGHWTLAAAIERTKDVVWSGTASYDTMCHNCRSLLEFFGASMPVESITTDQIDAFVRHCQTAKGNSGATVNRKLSCLSRVLRTAHERGKLAVLPKMPRRSEGEHRIRFLTQEEEAHLVIILERLALPDVADAVLCLLYTGFRCGELWRLERRDIDLERGTITAWKTKNHHPRTIPLVEKLRPIIARRAAACRQDTDRLFPGCGNEWLRRPWAIIRHLMGKDDDPQFVPHMLRHTCATRLSQAGVSLTLIKEWMGHTTIQTTARYAHFSPEDLRAAARLLG